MGNSRNFRFISPRNPWENARCEASSVGSRRFKDSRSKRRRRCRCRQSGQGFSGDFRDDWNNGGWRVWAKQNMMTGWCFGTMEFYDFPYLGNNDPNWWTHIFQRGSETTNQWWIWFSGWWFQTFFIFHNIWDNHSHWLIFFKMVDEYDDFDWISWVLWIVLWIEWGCNGFEGDLGGIHHITRGVRPRNHGFENRHVQLRV